MLSRALGLDRFIRPRARLAVRPLPFGLHVTFEHIIYIPGVLLVGITLGYILGARAVREELNKARRRARR